MTTEEIETDIAQITETFEELTLRHKKELKEFTAKTTALKKTATKGDKKRKKEVQNEIAKLETEFRKKQEEEVKQLQQQSPSKNESSGKSLEEEMKVVENSNYYCVCPQLKFQNSIEALGLILFMFAIQNNEGEDSDDDNVDIADKLLARMEAKRIEEEEKAALKASKAANIEVPKSKKPNRQKIRLVTYVI
jgi:hypothetical protein